MFASIPAAAPFAPSGGADVQPPTVDALLADHEALIARVKLAFGLDREHFTREVLPLIRAYAGYVHWLPATASEFFDRPGGLFGLGLETAFYSVQGTDAHIFSGRMTISARRHLEPRWRLATFVAGLCSELHRAVGQVSVVDEAGESWPAILQPLSAWLQARPSRKFRLHWHPQAGEARALSLLALPHAVPAATLQFLADGNDVVVPHLLACIGGLPLFRGRNALDELVRRAFALVVERDLRARDRTGDAPPGSPHLVRYLVEGMQRLIVDDSSWAPNSDKSRVWYAADGLFLVWPGVAGDLHRFLEGEQLAGMPKAPDTILEQFIAAGLIELPPGGGSLWRIRPRVADPPLTAVKLASPDVLLAALGAAPAPLPTRLSGAAAPAPGHVEGEQLTLIDGSEAATPPVPAGDARKHAGERRLNAPLRLDASVRKVLSTILAEMERDAEATETTAEGLFVPLSRFEAHRLAPPTALRALAEAGMLVRESAAAAPVVRRLDGTGKEVSGVIVLPQFVRPPEPP